MTTGFVKMHGCGNDFVILDERRHAFGLTPARAAALANRHTGIGCDQVILIAPAATADAFMHIFNPDGSPAGACGNATRCIADILLRETGHTAVTIQTVSGDLPAIRRPDGLIEVDMGPPRLDWTDIPLARPMDTLQLDLPGEPAAASMGNPHVTFFVSDLDATPMHDQGPRFEHHPLFPQRANIGFAQIIDPETIRLRVWERGAGLTLACGSGACAALVNAHRRGLARRHARVIVDGGILDIEWRHDGHVLMAGPVATVFRGQIDPMTIDILTFGCRLNAYESEVMRGLTVQAPNSAHTPNSVDTPQTADTADTVIVNTCAVTAEAERQARQAIRRVARDRPNARIVVTGCAAQIDPAAWAALPNVHRVLGNGDKLKPESWLPGAGSVVSDIMTARETAAHLVTEFAGRARAFVQVQQGCDHRCTFCIIPFGRGPNRSVPIGVIAGQVRALVAGGYQEVVLTGVDIASYGPDLPGKPSLGQMIRRLLLAVPDLPRLRLSSIDPAAIDDDLWRLIAEEPRLMPHLHLSLQAGSDLILKRMRRRHLRAGAMAVIDRARHLRPGIAVGADLIAGFPTETDALFEDTLRFVQEAALPYLHVFPYSERPGTPAARMRPVPQPVRKARAAALREAGAAAARRFFTTQIGRTVSLLTEAEQSGHSEHFAPVRLAQPVAPGRLLRARVTGVADDTLLAEAA